MNPIYKFWARFAGTTNPDYVVWIQANGLAGAFNLGMAWMEEDTKARRERRKIAPTEYTRDGEPTSIQVTPVLADWKTGMPDETNGTSYS